MTGNPFDASDGEWQVAVNGAGQYALWRPHLNLPAGWRIVHIGPDRDSALGFVEQHFTTLV
jgi:MbtH protein